MVALLPFPESQAEIRQMEAGRFCARYRENVNAMQRGVTAERVTQGVPLPGPTVDTLDVFFKKLPGQGEVLPAIIQGCVFSRAFALN